MSSRASRDSRGKARPPGGDAAAIDPTVTPPARTEGRSDGISSPEIKVYKAGENAKSDDRSTAAATRTT